MRADEAPDFSLFAGGPLFQLWRRAHLADEDLGRARRRMILGSLITWLPLLLFSALEGHVLGSGGPIPFLRDIECHIRFLVVVPLLIAAEPFVHERMRVWIAVFRERHLIPDGHIAQFDQALSGGLRLRNSTAAEALLLVLVYGVGVLVVWRHFVAIEGPTWYSTPAPGGARLSLAGLWFVWFSIPLFQFLLLRWYWRLFVWARFLWQVSHIPLALVPTHPDRVGGLGFLAITLRAYVPLALAHGALVAGQLANRIFLTGAKLTQFTLEIAYLVAFLLTVFIAPLWVFAPQLARAKRIGLREYGDLAEVYVRAFDAKWLRGGAPADEPLVGSGDIQSLADLGNSFNVIEEMRLAPVSRMAVLQLAAAIVVPILPLVLTMMPPEKLIQNLLGLVL